MNPLAWNKNVELETGVIASYWVVKNIYADMATLKVVVSYEGYLDQASYEAGKIRLLEKSASMVFDQTAAVAEVAAGVLTKAQQALDAEYPA